MNTLRWRIALAMLVIAASAIYVLPSFPGVKESVLGRFLPEKRISLGLDLKGGIHLTLGVEVDKAVANALAQTGQELRAEAQREGIALLRPRVIGEDRLEFILPRAAQQDNLREVLMERFATLATESVAPAESGQIRYVVRFTPDAVAQIKNMAQDQALRTIRNRVDQFGVAEPDIRKQADHRIQIQLPGISDPRRAVQLIGQTAHLEFHIVRDDVDPGRAVLPPGVVALPLMKKTDGRNDARQALVAVEKDALLTGEDIADARPNFDERGGGAYVMLNFNGRGARAFERVTGENAGKLMAIVLDGKVYSTPQIKERIAGGRASITGAFTTAEAQDLALVLRAGALPAPVTVLEERSVGPSLGQESINSGIRAAMAGAVAVVAFMTVYYGLSGIVANVMLLFTMGIVMAGMAAFGATLTLPGIAGIVLTIGMAVDANVLIFERIREELRRGFAPPAAVRAGFERASLSITDSNLTTIIATAVLYQFGTGPVRGFAVTLSLGILASMFTAIFVSRCIFEFWARKAGDRGISI